MPRTSYREAIAQAVRDINSIPETGELSESAVKQGLILRVLSAAGWDTFNVSEVQPDFRSGNSRVDFALMSPSSPRGRSAPTPLAFLSVKAVGENLDSERLERQLMSHCSRNEVPLAVLTNGMNWVLLSWSSDNDRSRNRFCEIDLAGDAEAAAEEINRYLSRDRVVNGQAARAAERELHDRNQDEVVRQAVLDGWRQVVRGLDEGLVELVATAAEQKAGERPENRFVRRVLMEHRTELLSATEDAIAPASSGGGSRRRPAAFTFESETHPVTSWPELLTGVCDIIRSLHPETFEGILQIRGRSLPYFSRNEEEVNQPREIGDSGIYASCQGAGVLIEGRAQRVVELFGYPRESLTIQTR